MDEQTRAGYEDQAKELRLELKVWETEWAKTHEGKKPGRNDIKLNLDIAQKYKHYQKTRDILDGKAQSPSKKTKRKSDIAPPVETPVKRAKHTETPSNNRVQDLQLVETPSISRKLFTPASVTSLGPTPQRDGYVLGLFDLLPQDTPSKSTLGAHESSRLFATPSKRGVNLDVMDTPKLARTPMSTSKRQMLNTFMTPLKNRDGNSNKTPSKLQFDTPQFLKRHCDMPTLDENGRFNDPAPLRLPRKPLGRGLSEIVASLRKVEEDHLDDDLDALRDAEDEEAGSMKPLPKPRVEQDILVKDSQQLPLGGFDDEGIFDSDVEEQKGRDGMPLRIYKKKGQKRTTRKVNSKPVWNRRPETATENRLECSEDEVIPETQAQASRDMEGAFVDVGSDSEFEAKTAKTQKKTQKKEKKEGPVKKVARKVNELAHANFQKLKLRQGGAKGGPGHNSRFRRRR